MFLIFDTETTGLPRNYKAPLTDFENWPRLVQIAWQLHDAQGKLVEVKNFIIKPDGFTIPFNSEKIHGISTERATKYGVELSFVLDEFEAVLKRTDFNVGHNIEFDLNIMGAEFLRMGRENPLAKMKFLDTMKQTIDFCALTGGRGGRFKYPNLSELYRKLFEEDFKEAHNASADVEATTRSFLELVRREIIPAKKLNFTSEQTRAFKKANPRAIKLIGLNIEPYNPHELEVDEKPELKKENASEPSNDSHLPVSEKLENTPFSHLHNHTQYSVLQATSRINDLISKAVEYKMPGLAITDLGNMYGAFHFVREIIKHNQTVEKENEQKIEEGKDPDGHLIKPIVGCEFYICKDHKDKSTKDNGYQVVVLAKSKKGYQNLVKLASISFVDGFYYVPRIDKDLLLKYKDELIVTTGGIRGEVPGLLLNVGDSQAKEAFLWWKTHFKDDFYIELVRHNLEEENRVNKIMVSWGKEFGVKYFAANNTFYVEQDDAVALDVLLCVKEGEKIETPIGHGRGFRYGFPNQEYYFKSPGQMKVLFNDLPESIETTNEIVNKIEEYTLARDVLLPKFDIPKEFIDPEDAKDGGNRGENAYLKQLTYEGIKKRYGEINEELKERIEFELKIIENTGYPGYFLIVQDFTSQARKMGVWVGPGRGSAAGSVVAYAIGITNVDPIKYDLLFERFLNPDRVSMPDIDIDFDDEGRGKIIDWVVEKYGSDQVAQIITYGTMAARSSIRDTGRVLDLPLSETDRLAKLLPDNLSLSKIFGLSDKELKKKVNADALPNVTVLKEASDSGELKGKTIHLARKIEGALRNIGTHACGIIIAPDNLTNHVPVARAKDSKLLVTQFDNSVVESAGLLKMDFLGLKTLSIIKDAIALIKERTNKEIDPDAIPLDDEKTYKLYQKGHTNGTFQFESRGMQKHLRALKPDKFEDLIAMNALFRPGPMEYIPEFIARKNGEKKIVYDVPEMEEFLAETYGITVYQEQVMLLSQKLAGFTKGQADTLRKAMGKKIKALLDKMKPVFISGCVERGIEDFKAEKIWRDWEAFAQYAFNKSHSTCYSVIAYQTAYLKAHYPAEYMAAVLTHNMNDIKKVTFFMEECRRMGLAVLGPCVNESGLKFRVNDQGLIRFGLAGIKGVGGSAVQSIIREREENGEYKSLWDLTSRAESQQVNKRVLENLVYSGALDAFELNRSTYFIADHKSGRSLIETAIKYGMRIKENKNSIQVSMFGDSDASEIPPPKPPEIEEWKTFEKLKKEREVVGIFISGHPLDDFSLEIENFCYNTTKDLIDLKKLSERGNKVSLAGIISHVEHRISKAGKPWGKFTLEDYEGSHEFILFNKDYIKLKNMINEDWFVFVEASVAYNDYRQQVEIKIIDITILPDLIDKKASAIEIDLDVKNLEEAGIKEIADALNAPTGKLSVKFKLFDNKTHIGLKSRKKGIQINKEVAKKLKRIDNLKFRLV